MERIRDLTNIFFNATSSSDFFFEHSASTFYYDSANLRGLLPGTSSQLLELLPYTSFHLICLHETCRIFSWEKSWLPKHLMTTNFQSLDMFVDTFWIHPDLLAWALKAGIALWMIRVLIESILADAHALWTLLTRVVACLEDLACEACNTGVRFLESFLVGTTTSLEQIFRFCFQTMCAVVCWQFKTLSAIAEFLCCTFVKSVMRTLRGWCFRFTSSISSPSKENTFKHMEAKFTQRHTLTADAEVTQEAPEALRNTNTPSAVTDSILGNLTGHSVTKAALCAEDFDSENIAKSDLKDKPTDQGENLVPFLEVSPDNVAGNATIESQPNTSQSRSEQEHSAAVKGENTSMPTKADHNDVHENTNDTADKGPPHRTNSETAETVDDIRTAFGTRFPKARRWNNKPRPGKDRSHADESVQASSEVPWTHSSFQSSEAAGKDTTDDPIQPRAEATNNEPDQSATSTPSHPKSGGRQSPDFWQNPTEYMSHVRDRTQNSGSNKETPKTHNTGHGRNPHLRPKSDGNNNGRFYHPQRENQQEPRTRNPQRPDPNKAYTKPQYQPQHHHSHSSTPQSSARHHHHRRPPTSAQDPPPPASHTVPEKFNPYTTLSVPRTASAQEIKRAYRRLALALHPDKHTPRTTRLTATATATAEDQVAAATATRAFQDLQRAYEILSDDVLRVVYHLVGIKATADRGLVAKFELVYGPYRGGELLARKFASGEL